MTSVTKKPKVVFVDDDAFFRKALQVALETAGFKVFAYRSVQALMDAQPDVDLYLLDVRLPELYGDAATKILLRDGAVQRRRVLLLSGIPEDELARRAEAVEADGYVSKDAGIGAIVERARQMLHEP